MKKYKRIFLVILMLTIATNTFALGTTLLDKEKKYVSELLPSMMLCGHELNLHKDLGLNPNNTEIVDYSLKVGSKVQAWDVVTVTFSDGSVIKKGIDDYSVGGSHYEYTNFQDTKGHWAEKDIRKAYSDGTINGLGDYFGVSTPIKMHEMCIILNRAFIRADFPVRYTNRRTDINNSIQKGHWASADISNLMGLMLDRVPKYKNYNGTLYGFELTRLDVADMLRSIIVSCQSSYAEMNKDVGLNVDALRTYTKPGATYIADLNRGDEEELYWTDSINHTIRAGLMSVDDKNNFFPDRSITRAELAVIINRLESVLKIEKEIYNTIYEKYVSLPSAN